MNYVLLPPGLPLTCILNQNSASSHGVFIDRSRCLSAAGVIQHSVSENSGFLFSSSGCQAFLCQMLCCFSFSGLGLWLPSVCSHVFCLSSRFAVMACCWALDPEERPKFQQLVQCLTEFHAALGAYVWNCGEKIQFTDWEEGMAYVCSSMHHSDSHTWCV